VAVVISLYLTVHACAKGGKVMIQKTVLGRIRTSF